MYTVVNHKTVN